MSFHLYKQVRPDFDDIDEFNAERDELLSQISTLKNKYDKLENNTVFQRIGNKVTTRRVNPTKEIEQIKYTQIERLKGIKDKIEVGVTLPVIERRREATLTIKKDPDIILRRLEANKFENIVAVTLIPTDFEFLEKTVNRPFTFDYKGSGASIGLKNVTGAIIRYHISSDDFCTRYRLAVQDYFFVDKTCSELTRPYITTLLHKESMDFFFRDITNVLPLVVPVSNHEDGHNRYVGYEVNRKNNTPIGSLWFTPRYHQSQYREYNHFFGYKTQTLDDLNAFLKGDIAVAEDAEYIYYYRFLRSITIQFKTTNTIPVAFSHKERKFSK